MNVAALPPSRLTEDSQINIFQDYNLHESSWDELIHRNYEPHPHCKGLVDWLSQLSTGEFKQRRQNADWTFINQGITFSVYSDFRGTEKIFPFDVIPRIVQASDWRHIEAGLKQRINALNKFIDDVYHDQLIIKDGVLPREILDKAKSFRPQCIGLNPPKGIWCHITGTDLVRHTDGAIYVLEDNLRCPSGVSYVLQNRLVMKRSFPQQIGRAHV